MLPDRMVIKNTLHDRMVRGTKIIYLEILEVITNR